jgi:hypothetical protein
MCVATNNIDTRHTMLQGSQSVDPTLETQSSVTVTRAPSRESLTIITQYSPSNNSTCCDEPDEEGRE